MGKPDDYVLGAILEPDKLGTPNISVLGVGTDEIPDQYIVSSFRHWFGDKFGLNQALIEPWYVSNQGSIPSCVAEAAAKQKSTQEGKKISKRDIYRLAKRKDGTSGPTTWGTTLDAAQDAILDPGVADDDLVEDERSDINAFVSLDDVVNDVDASRAENRGKSYFRVERTDFMRAILDHGTPITTSCQWYESDNAISRSGMMKMPSGRLLGGHSFLCIGWVLKQDVDMTPCFVMVNSFGPNWGDNGLFYVPVKDVINRLTSGRIAVDRTNELSSLLAKYNEKNLQVTGSPDIYRCELGVLRKYPDEITWWAFGNLFGIETYDISFVDFEHIPRGKNMDINNAPFRTKELVRQIRQHYGQL